MKTLKTFLIAAAAFAFMLVAASPANAWSAVSFVPSGGGYAVFNGNTLKVCDTAGDGRSVRAEMQNGIGTTTYYSGWVNAGTDCGYEGHLNTYRFRACNNNPTSCGPWQLKN